MLVDYQMALQSRARETDLSYNCHWMVADRYRPEPQSCSRCDQLDNPAVTKLVEFGSKKLASTKIDQFVSTSRFKGLALVALSSLALLISACSDNGGSSVGNTGGDGTGGTNSGGSTGGTGGTGGANSGGSGIADLPVLNGASGDDFSVDSLEQWSLRHQVEGTDPQYSLLDINQTTVGALTIEPTLTPGWFAGGDAPLVYRLVDGNFTVETEVTVTSTSNPPLPPQSDFNSAGLMARNPAGANGAENYIMVNIGRQNGTIPDGVGTEHKSTTNSNSVLSLQAGSTSGRLLLCRVGDEFSTYRFLDNETGWSLIETETRTDMPQQLQVGIVANGFSGPDLRAVFEYIQLRVPTNSAQCLP